MTRHPDLDRALEEWLIDGPSQMPNRVLDSIVTQIDHTKQQRRPGWLPGRYQMNRTLLTLGGVAAAVAVVVVAGAMFLGVGANRPGVGGQPQPAPTASPSPLSPTPSAEASAPEASAEPAEPTPGPLPEGPFVLVYEQLFGVRTTVTIPAPDWHGLPFLTIVEKQGMADPPQGAGLFVYGGDMLVYGDPCEWESTRPDDPAASLDEFVAALSAQASRDATPPEDVTVGGYAGKKLTLRVPEDAVFTDCDGGEFRTLMEVSTSGDEAPRTHEGPGQISEVWVVDVDGTLVFFDAAYFAATPAEYVEEMRAMIESATFAKR